MSKKFSNELSDAQAERLSILLEEMGEALQCIGKIQRHGYESYNPVVSRGLTNRRDLERELGHVSSAIKMLADVRDINMEGVKQSMVEKGESIRRWLHHQEAPCPK